MIQTSRPVADCVPVCVTGHRPQLVETRGMPTGHRVGESCPTHYHIECHTCGQAIEPTPSKALAELRWRSPAQRFPLSQLRLARLRAVAYPQVA
jgi:hypothetical protein